MKHYLEMTLINLIKKGKLKNKDNNSDNKSDGIKTSLPVDDTGRKNKKVGGLNPKPAMS